METSEAGDTPRYLYGKFTKEKEHCIKKITGAVWPGPRVKKKSRNWVKEKGRGSACTLL